MKIETFINNLGIAKHPALRINHSLQGFTAYTFGCTSGPAEPNVRNLAHELAHAAQFGPKSFRYRCIEGNFQFKLNRIFVFDRYCVEPRTNQATLRELETAAMQAHLMEAGGVNLDRQDFFRYFAKLMIDWMADWYHIPGANELDRLAWCFDKLNEFYGQHSQAAVIGRLIGWLDATERRFNRQGRPPEYVSSIFRVDANKAERMAVVA